MTNQKTRASHQAPTKCRGSQVPRKAVFLRDFAFTSSQIVPHYDELMSRPVAEVS